MCAEQAAGRQTTPCIQRAKSGPLGGVTKTRHYDAGIPAEPDRWRSANRRHLPNSGVWVIARRTLREQWQLKGCLLELY